MKAADAVAVAFCMTNGVLDKLVLAGSPVHKTDKTFLAAYKVKIQAGTRTNNTEDNKAMEIFNRYWVNVSHKA